MPGRVQMGAIVGGELHLLDRPALPIRQVLWLQSLEKLQHARQPLLVIDVLDGGMPARRIGRDIVLQGHGNIDQSSGHQRSPEASVMLSAQRQTSWRSTRFFRMPMFSTSSSTVSPCSRYQPSSSPQPLPRVPDPMNSPGIRVSSLVTCAMISSNENSIPSVTPFERVLPLTRASALSW